LTRSHHFLLAEANKLPAIHIADNDGVTFKTCTAEVFRPVPKNQKPKFSINRGSQGLRRPRFSFFIFTCQTARVQGPTSISGRSRSPISTANDNRLSSAVDSLILMRSFTGTKTCFDQGPKQRRAQWPGYRPPRSGLSTPVVNKSSHHPRESCAARKPRFLGTLRRT